MNYITHSRFKKLALCKEQLNIPYGTKLISYKNILYTLDGKAICSIKSENAKLHFSINEDGHGLERGALTYAIAYSNRKQKNGFRFSDKEAEILAKDWSHFLRNDVDVILFNDDFFTADVEELQRLAKALNIKIKGR